MTNSFKFCATIWLPWSHRYPVRTEIHPSRSIQGPEKTRKRLPQRSQRNLLPSYFIRTFFLLCVLRELTCKCLKHSLEQKTLSSCSLEKREPFRLFREAHNRALKILFLNGSWSSVEDKLSSADYADGADKSIFRSFRESLLYLVRSAISAMKVLFFNSSPMLAKRAFSIKNRDSPCQEKYYDVVISQLFPLGIQVNIPPA